MVGSRTAEELTLSLFAQPGKEGLGFSLSELPLSAGIPNANCALAAQNWEQMMRGDNAKITMKPRRRTTLDAKAERQGRRVSKTYVGRHLDALCKAI